MNKEREVEEGKIRRKERYTETTEMKKEEEPRRYEDKEEHRV